MRALLLIALLALLGGCAETVRCPDGQVFGDDGRCTRIADAGTGDSEGTDGG